MKWCLNCLEILWKSILWSIVSKRWAEIWCGLGRRKDLLGHWFLTVKNSCFTLGGSSYLTAMIHSTTQSGISASMRLELTLSYKSNSSSSLFHPKFPFIFFYKLTTCQLLMPKNTYNTCEIVFTLYLINKVLQVE